MTVMCRSSENPVRRKARMDPRTRRIAKRSKRPALSLNERERLAEKCRRVTCSRPWNDEATIEADIQGIQPASSRVPDLLAQYQIYPPLADNTPMSRCRCQNCSGGRLWPLHYMTSTGYSVECAYERMSRAMIENLPSSPGVVDMARMKAAHRAGRNYP